jgi:hypothetical protein
MILLFFRTQVKAFVTLPTYSKKSFTSNVPLAVPLIGVSAASLARATASRAPQGVEGTGYAAPGTYSTRDLTPTGSSAYQSMPTRVEYAPSMITRSWPAQRVRGRPSPTLTSITPRSISIPKRSRMASRAFSEE